MSPPCQVTPCELGDRVERLLVERDRLLAVVRQALPFEEPGHVEQDAAAGDAGPGPGVDAERGGLLVVRLRREPAVEPVLGVADVAQRVEL